MRISALENFFCLAPLAPGRQYAVTFARHLTLQAKIESWRAAVSNLERHNADLPK
jgi:hypothetical protein